MPQLSTNKLHIVVYNMLKRTFVIVLNITKNYSFINNVKNHTRTHTHTHTHTTHTHTPHGGIYHIAQKFDGGKL